MNEFYWASARKPHLKRAEALVLSDLERMRPLATAPLNADTHFVAHDLRDRTNYAWWDCLLLASALGAKCAYFLSEDLQHEHVLDGLTILNPFRADPAEVLGA